MVLDQDKLNVSNKTQSNPFTWKGQFTPEFVEYLLDCYTRPGMRIADPFSGSGTVLLESVRRGCGCVGFEINPSAYYMSKFYEYSALNQEERELFMKDLSTFLVPAIESLPIDMPLYTDHKDYREAYSNLLSFSSWIAHHIDRKYWPFVLNILFLCEKDKRMTFRMSVCNNFEKIRSFFFALPHSDRSVNVFNDDARSISKRIESKVDFILTSPPYINVFNYHQNYRGIIECFDYDILKVANSEIGSNRKNRSNRYKTVVQYAVEMGCVLYESTKVLKRGGKMVYVVGKESNVRKTPFFNSCIIKDLGKAISGLSLLEENSRVFRNRYGEIIQEDILTFEKTSDHEGDYVNDFKNVGFLHLSNALDYASEESRDDIDLILSGKEMVNISPIFT